ESKIIGWFTHTEEKSPRRENCFHGQRKGRIAVPVKYCSPAWITTERNRDSPSTRFESYMTCLRFPSLHREAPAKQGTSWTPSSSERLMQPLPPAFFTSVK